MFIMGITVDNKELFAPTLHNRGTFEAEELYRKKHRDSSHTHYCKCEP